MDAFSPLSILYVILGLIALIAALLVWAVRTARKREEERRRVTQEFGFREAPERAEELAARMKILHHHWSDHHGLDNLKGKTEWGYELLLFDLCDSSGDSVGREPDQAVCLSPDLRLPRFTIFPKMEGTGVMASMTNKALGWVASRFAVHPAFPDAPEFDAKYLIWGDDEAALREFFTPARLGRLAETEEIQLEGSGDALLFSWVPYHQVKKTYAEKLQYLLQNGRVLFDIFKD